MSGIRIDGALGRTVRKRDTVSLERFDSRIGYERAKITTNKTTPFLLLNRCMLSKVTHLLAIGKKGDKFIKATSIDWEWQKMNEGTTEQKSIMVPKKDRGGSSSSSSSSSSATMNVSQGPQTQDKSFKLEG